MTHGEGRVLTKCKVTFFQKLLAPFLHLHTKFKQTVEMSWVPIGGGPERCHKITQGRGGSKISKKNCHVLFEWSLKLSIFDQTLNRMTFAQTPK